MSELINAIKQICEEKGLSYESVLVTIESALAAAFRKDFGEKNQNIVVEFDPETAKSKVFDVKTVVEDMPEVEEEEEGEEVESASAKAMADKGKKEDKKKEKKIINKKEEEVASVEVVVEEEERKFNPKTEIQISDAKLIKKTAKIDGIIKTKLEIPSDFGRMAAQTAKQVIIQRLREAERETIFNDFKDKEHEVIGGVIQRREGRVVLIDLGKSVGILTMDEQIPGEIYNSGERIKVYVKEVRMGSKGPEIILSRTSDEILKKVFYLEIPEISNGLIEIKSVAREAGSRSKVAVSTDSENVDPIGSCVGQRGARIQTVISELGGEKVDIIEYSDDAVKFIENALSPAKIIKIDLDEEKKVATIKVAGDQLSLAIGKHGQNARLAARLTGWKIDIVEDGGTKEEGESDKGEEEVDDKEVDDKKEKKSKKDDNKEKDVKKSASTKASADKEGKKKAKDDKGDDEEKVAKEKKEEKITKKKEEKEERGE